MAEQHSRADTSEQPFATERLKLARLHAGKGVKLKKVWNELSEVVSATLKVERLGVWVLIDGGEAIRCRFLSQQSTHQLFQGSVLHSRDFPAYFRAVANQRVVAADDVLTSPLTAELRKTYLQPLGITSMLDAPIYSEGRMVGVVCHEHIGAPRHWNASECDFAMAVADNVSRLYQEHLRHNAESSLREYEAHLLELHRLEAVGRMAAGIAHDFRNILAATSGYAELALRAPGLSADVERYLRQIFSTMERGTHLVHRFAGLGREEAVSPCVLDVKRVIQSLTDMLQVLCGNQVECKFALDAAVSRVFLDGAQLERVLLNLVLNARDAMPSGGVVSISAHDAQISNGEEQDTFVEISVADTGIGMDAATRESILKPFFTTKGDQGTGLGLSVVDQIVSRAGGSIHFDSELGHGTTVKIYLPRIASAA